MCRCEAQQRLHTALCRGFYCSPRVVANYSLKWNCSHSHMKPSAQIRHKSHSLPFCRLNHFPVWVPRFCVLSKHANIFSVSLLLASFPQRRERNDRTWSRPGFFYHLWDGANRTHVLRIEILFQHAVCLIEPSWCVRSCFTYHWLFNANRHE